MRIVKKKNYYYLRQTVRKKGKVITREKYLGKKIPKNINKIKEQFSQESKKEIYEKLEQIKKHFQTEWKKIPKSAKERELQEIAIAFTYNTNAIEGSTITLEETREIIKEETAPNKLLRDIKETGLHYKVFLEMIDKKQKITKSLFLQWHKALFEETKKNIAGKFRDYLVRIGDYLAIDWEDINKEINKLIRFIEKEKTNTVELAARAHYKFEKIHPFGDGNGRIGRILMNHILWHNKYPMLIIEYKKRKSYYKALKKDEDGFADYFIRRYLTVHKRRLR